MSLGRSIAVGNDCWIEAITLYKGHGYKPRLRIGDHVAISDWTHISVACDVDIGEGCLIGSNVYIGDHSHGSLRDAAAQVNTFPADRPLGDLASISIGAGSWICDGAVILAGTRIAPHSVVGANSVVRVSETRPAVIVGAPARVSRYLD
jgi:acetyltransferase-like isoleucine patch superfamily enzyme